MTLQISLLMKRLGRKAGFVIGVVLGIVGALICGAAAWINNFWLLCFGTFIVGGYIAAGQYYPDDEARVARFIVEVFAVARSRAMELSQF